MSHAAPPPDSDAATAGPTSPARDPVFEGAARGAAPTSAARALLRRKARPVRRAVLASDMHLAGDEPEGVARACDLLLRARDEQVDAIFLLGDVFRAWLGTASLSDPGLRPFLDALADATAHDVRVVLVHGNHDFMLGAELGALGVEVVPRALDVACGGRRVRLLHGDAFCTLDVGYHRLHRVLRHPVVEGVFRRMPARALRRMADALLHGASRTTSAKPLSRMDIVDDAVREVFAEGVDVVVCGHVHRARDARLAHPGGEGRLVVLADFETRGSHAWWREGEIELVPDDATLACSRPPVVAIDGPAGSGKSTVARRLAERLGWLRLDSGALYRAVTLCARREGLALDDAAALGALAARLDLRFDPSGHVLLDGRPIADAELRSPAVSAAVSPVSAAPGVRAALLDAQRQVAWMGRGLVADGRDMATVVFPDAVLSVFLDARPEVRAARRLAQGSGEGRSLGQVEAALLERDERDRSRAAAPLAVAEGAWVLDTSEMTVDEVVERLAERVQERLRSLSRGHPAIR
ncbi:MAG: (d)CMP kinase [Planctomycetes bacterium]|nr:(d)CMP kinase [Planctomycetota bacterium]